MRRSVYGDRNQRYAHTSRIKLADDAGHHKVPLLFDLHTTVL